jgi:sirohydrochlorin cobaltochelatase
LEVEKEALILFAHGSRDAQWAVPFRAVQKKIALARPGLRIELAFLEIMQPSLPDAIDRLVAAGHVRLVIAPLFMAQGAHLKRDLAALLTSARARHAHIETVLLPAAGEAEAVLDAIGAWVTAHV